MSNEKKNDGGPAFPGNGEQFVEGVHGIQPQSAYGMQGSPGMSLRDHFAGLAMQGMRSSDAYMARAAKLATRSGDETVCEFLARLAYEQADFMLKARER